MPRKLSPGATYTKMSGKKLPKSAAHRSSIEKREQRLLKPNAKKSNTKRVFEVPAVFCISDTTYKNAARKVKDYLEELVPDFDAPPNMKSFKEGKQLHVLTTIKTGSRTVKLPSEKGVEDTSPVEELDDEFEIDLDEDGEDPEEDDDSDEEDDWDIEECEYCGEEGCSGDCEEADDEDD